ncbi:MAG: beta-ketoacyl-ACP synthase [Sandaracinaceae bacterium]|nr:beta-ketoacyl-ACP synthase [Sandaracinaceae bacterium]
MGTSTRDVLSALSEGRAGLSACPLDVPFAAVCGVVDGILPSMPHALARSHSRTAQLALLGFEQISHEVARAVERYGASRIGMFIGTSTGGISQTEAFYTRYRDTGEIDSVYDYARQHEFFAFTDVLRAVSGIRGPRSVVSTACSSGAKVFTSARRLLDAGVIDAALVGGVDSLCQTTVRGFHSLGVMDPKPCRPFAADRSGMNVGEGVGMLLLERSAEPRAMFLGAGETSDAFDMASPEPDGRGAREAMRYALDEAGIEVSQIDYINAHGTATRRNDSAESAAIHALFPAGVAVASTKSYTGHTLGAAGAIEAVFAIAAIEQSFIPANLGLHMKDPELHVNAVAARIAKPVRYALSNSLAFGGSNASLLFGSAR